MIGVTEVIIIGALIIFLFGGKKAIEWARTLGQMQKEFKQAASDIPAKKTVKA